MDNINELYKEYDELLTEVSRIRDYEICYSSVITAAERIELDAHKIEIDDALELLNKRLERINNVTEIIDSLE